MKFDLGLKCTVKISKVVPGPMWRYYFLKFLTVAQKLKKKINIHVKSKDKKNIS